MWNKPVPLRRPVSSGVDYTTLATLKEILARSIRIESKIHALANGLKVDINQQLVDELQAELPQ